MNPFVRTDRLRLRSFLLQAWALTLLLLAPVALAQSALVPHSLPTGSGKSITLSLPHDFDINVALTGLRRVRFFAKAPDGRLFVTDMYDRTDNKRGAVY